MRGARWIVGIAAGLALAMPAVGLADGSTLSFDVSITATFGDGPCPPDATATTSCFHYTARSVVPGLGVVSLAWDESVDRSGACGVWKLYNGTWTTPRGPLAFSGTSTGCPSIDEAAGASIAITLGGGITGASGTVSADFGQANVTNSTEGLRWQGTLTIPGTSFDMTPPVLSTAATKIVKIRKGIGAHVAYKITASDAVDGVSPVTCSPRSGTFDVIGATTVTCVATDKSGNTATIHFLVIVRRGR